MSAPARLLRAARVEGLLRRFADSLSVSIVIEDGEGSQLASAAPSAPGPQHRAAIGSAPLRAGADDVGSVTVTGGDGAQAIAELVADVVGERLAREAETRDLTTELLSRYEEVNLLYDLGEALAAVLDVPTLCEIAMERATRAVGAQRAFVALAAPETDRYDIVSAQGYGAPSATTDVPDESVSAQVVASGLQVLLHPEEHYEAVLCVPLIRPGDEEGQHGPRAIGALNLSGKRPGERFSAGDARLATTIATELAVAILNSRLVESQRQAERARQELEIAAGIQRGLLPDAPPEIPGADVAGLCVPATSVGGDYFDMLLAETGLLTLVIADVAGHSIGSALMMAMARIILRREVSEGHGPGAVLGATNDAMLSDLVRAGLFITAFCAQFDLSTRRLRYANAAHNLPLVCLDAGRKVRELDADGMPLGILEGVEYEERTIQLAPGDVLLLYTDGVVETRDSGGEQFGDKRLHETLTADASESARELTDGVLGAVRRHLGGGTQQDDITLLALRVDR